MPEQATSVSSGLSPLLKIAKPGRSEVSANAETVSKNGSAFSKNLNQVRQQQLNKTQSELFQRGSGKDSSQSSGAVLNHSVPSISSAQAIQSDESRLSQDLAGDDSAAVDVTGRSIPIDAEESAGHLLVVTGQQLPRAVKQDPALSSEQQPPVIMSVTGNADPVSNPNQDPAPAQMLEQQSVVATAVVPPVSTTIVEPVNGTVGEVVTPATLVGRSRQLSSDQQTPSAAGPVAAEPPAAVLSRDLNQVRQRQLNKTQPELLQRGSGKDSSQTTGVVLKHSLSSISSAQASQSDESRLSQDLADDDSAAIDVTGRPISIEVEESAAPLLVATGRQLPRAVKQDSVLSSEQRPPVIMSATDDANPVPGPALAQLLEQQSVTATAVEPPVSSTIVEPVKGTVGEVVTPATLAGRSRQFSSGLQATSEAEPSAANGLVANANPSAAKGLDTTMGRLPEEPVKSFVVRQPATEHDATLATAATMAGWSSNLNSDAVSPGTETTQNTNDIRLAQAVQPSLSIKGDSLPTDDMPLANESLSDMESLMGFTDSNATVHQRIATTEAVLSQMAMEADDATVKMPTADNLLQAISGGTMAAPTGTQSVPVTGPIIQAPLNVPLASADAETALAGNVKWMTSEGVKSAVMTVTPHGMGPISVKIAIDGAQMDVSIIASQHATRDALESMLPRLREQLAVQGHETVKVDVSDGKSEQSRSGNGQTFADSRNPTGASPQDNQSNSRNHGEKTEYGRTDDLQVVSESFMAEDLQRVAARAIGEADSRPVFDAYV